MLSSTRQEQTLESPNFTPAAPRRRLLTYAPMALGAALAVNSLLGPALLDRIDYGLTESLRNQQVGLDIVSLVLVAPLSVFAGALALRGRAAGPVLALAPATYTVYMFAQYIVGPGYQRYTPATLFHLAVFVLAGFVAVAAWNAVDSGRLPAMTPRQREVRSRVLFGLGAFVVLRYLPALVGSFGHEPLTAEFRAEPAFFWSIFLMDLGIVVPSALAAGVALRTASPTAPRAMYGLVGWFALVPPSVAAMALTMVLNEDPFASTGSMVMFVAAAALFGAFAIRVFRPLVAPGR